MTDPRFTPDQLLAGRRLVGLLSLDVEYSIEGNGEVTAEDFMVVMSEGEFRGVTDVIEMLTAARGVILALLLAADPDDPRSVLQKIAETYQES